MSYSIDEGLDDARKALDACEQIKARFPDARLSGKVWETELLKPEECDYLTFDGDTQQMIRVGTLVGGKMVARRFDLTAMTPFILFLDMRQKAPELYAQVLRFAAGAKPTP